MSRVQLSKNFYLDEFLRSDAAARRGHVQRVSAGGVIGSNLTRLCRQVLQPLRDELGPVHVLSGYRDSKVNRWVGGSSTSQHCYGLAADIVVTGCSPLEVCQWIHNHVMYDQLINEFGQWCHVSIAQPYKPYRMQAFTAIKKPRPMLKPKTVYVPGISTIDEAMEAA
jgi:hypothetical protein